MKTKPILLVIAALAVVAIVGVASFLVGKNSAMAPSPQPPAGQPGSGTAASSSPATGGTTSGTAWNGLDSQVEAAARSAFANQPVGQGTPVKIRELVDLTGDGVPEALVSLGSAGAYTDAFTLMRLENGAPVVMQAADQDGKPGAVYFMQGASVRHGVDFKLWPERHAYYTGEYSTADTLPITLETCTATGFLWKENAKTFFSDPSLSRQATTEFCSHASSTLNQG